MKQLKLSKNDKELYRYGAKDNCVYFVEVLFFSTYKQMLKKIPKDLKKKLSLTIFKKDRQHLFFEQVFPDYLKSKFEKANYLRPVADIPTRFYHAEALGRHFCLAPFRGFLVTDGKPTQEDINKCVEMFVFLYPKVISFYKKHKKLYPKEFQTYFNPHVLELEKHIINGKINA